MNQFTLLDRFDANDLMSDTTPTEDESEANAPNVEMLGDSIKPTDVEIEYDLEVGFDILSQS